MPIKITNLSFCYRKELPIVINNLSLQIQDGTINVLLGLNGCGKTTLIKLLAGLLSVKDGLIEYGESNLKDVTIKQRSKIFAYVPQRTIVADDFKVKDYLTYGFANSMKFYKSPSKDHLIKIDELSKKLNIFHLLEKNLGEISGGERQIVSIAACLLQDTPIILLDEPTSALDLKNQANVLTILNEVAKEGKTIVLSSHNPNHALFLNSNVILMDKGIVVKTGTASDIVKKEILSNIYGSNIAYSKELNYQEITFK